MAQYAESQAGGDTGEVDVDVAKTTTEIDASTVKEKQQEEEEEENQKDCSSKTAPVVITENNVTAQDANGIAEPGEGEGKGEALPGLSNALPSLENQSEKDHTTEAEKENANVDATDEYAETEKEKTNVDAANEHAETGSGSDLCAATTVKASHAMDQQKDDYAREKVEQQQNDEYASKKEAQQNNDYVSENAEQQKDDYANQNVQPQQDKGDNVNDTKTKLENEQQQGDQEQEPPPEADGVEIRPHWHAKPALRLTIIGGSASEEDLMPLFAEFGKVSSIVFENDRKDTAVIRYDSSTCEAGQFVTKVKERLHNTQLDDRNLLIDSFFTDSLLFIGNLTPDINDSVLHNMFKQHGTIERAFVLRNAAGRSKCYGFVEYSLKSQALAAKSAMGNLNMDGRVLRVEWSDCKRVADMFSTVLFVDRLPKGDPNLEGSLRALFGQYGKVKDCYLAVGMNNQLRGFAFIDFYHSSCADMAHEALDGQSLQGHTIRVSFANPSKSAQSYKVRFGSQLPYSSISNMNRGVVGSTSMMGGQMTVPMAGYRLMGPGHSGMMVTQQFAQGSHVGQTLLDQSHASGSGLPGLNTGSAGMLSRPPMMNSMLPRQSMTVRPTLGSLPSIGSQGPHSVLPSQMATAEPIFHEEKPKAEEFYYQPPHQGELQYNHQQAYQQTAQQAYQQPIQQPYQTQVQPLFQSQSQQQYSQQVPQPQSLQSQYQVGSHAQQPYGPYYTQQSQSYTQVQHPLQPQQSQIVSAESYNYSQQFGSQIPQQFNQLNNQSGFQQYQQQAAQHQAQVQYSQTAYSDSYVRQQQQHIQQLPLNALSHAASQPGFSSILTQDSYHQQQSQLNIAQVPSGCGSSVQVATITGSMQPNIDAQWAAYYANQAAYQQQNTSYSQQTLQGAALTPVSNSYNEQSFTAPDVGQKRTADQMESGSHGQITYNYPHQAAGHYPQQAVPGALPYQQAQTIPSTYQHNAVPPPISGYQLQSNAQHYQPTGNVSGFQQQATPSVATMPDGYQQQTAAQPTGFQPIQGQAIATAAYDYKRPRV